MCRLLPTSLYSAHPRESKPWRQLSNMADFQLQYADANGQVHNQVVQGTSDHEVRERYSRQGFLVYTVKAKGGGLVGGIRFPGSRRRLNLEKFLIFNQQFVTLVRAGLPILKALD